MLQSGRICRGNSCRMLIDWLIVRGLIFTLGLNQKKPQFYCLHWSPCVGKLIQRIVEQKNVQCPAFIPKIWAKFRVKQIFGCLVSDPNTMRACVNWSILDNLPLVHFRPCPTSSAFKPKSTGSWAHGNLSAIFVLQVLDAWQSTFDS